MTALSKYQRLEAPGLWRASPEAQRSDVIASIGDETLVITDTHDRVLTHWSLPAVARANPGKYPAIYHPDGDPGETLELARDESEMITAIEKLRAAIERRRPHPGRLRLMTFLASMATVLALLVFWLPGAARNHAVSVVPDVKREEIGRALLAQLQRITGPACEGNGGKAVLASLAKRLPAAKGPGLLIIVRDGVKSTIHLPGGIIMINRALVEDFDEPDVVAGYIATERLRATGHDPLADLLDFNGLWSSFRLLTTGRLSDKSLQSYAQHLLAKDVAALSQEVILAEFSNLSLRSTSYAYALDMSGETTLGLIEADPFAHTASEAVLTDTDWLRLQGICGG
jgi:hypothetical protein